MRKKFLTFQQYKEHFLSLIELEREEEIRLHRREIENLTPFEREKRGNAIINLKLTKTEEWIQGKRLTYFSRQEEIKNTNIKEGDMVLVSVKNPLREKRFATVKAVYKHGLVVVFDTLPNILRKKKVRIDLYVNEITYNRMKKALNSIPSILFPPNFLLCGDSPTKKEQEVGEFYNKELNESQKQAVKKALSFFPLFLIHGPPGTGKTTTLVEYVLQEVKRGKRVLVCADSNTAVDNIMEKLLKYTDDVVRLGNPVRISPFMLPHTLDTKLSSSPSLNQINKEIKQREQERSKYLPYSRKNAHGLSKEEVLALNKIKRSTRKVPLKKIRSMAKYLLLSEEIKRLKQLKKEVEEREIQKIISSTSIVCTTNSTAGIEFLQDEMWDVVVIDEATQATEPSTLIPLIKARKAVLAGDHKQLPPTIISEKAKKELQISLFERWISCYPQASHMLDIQYRMRSKIASFSNKHFYDNQLSTHRTAESRDIEELIPVHNYTLTKNELIKEIINHDIIFVHHEDFEKRKRGSTSIHNPTEAEIISLILSSLLKLGIKEEHIGIITPYDDQVEMLRKKIKKEGVEIKTVDGFQGREKEIIIISFVRSNLRSSLGFLEDLRRLNVSITRARRKLIIVGNIHTLSKHKTYKALIDYIKKEGKIIDASALFNF